MTPRGGLIRALVGRDLTTQGQYLDVGQGGRYTGQRHDLRAADRVVGGRQASPNAVRLPPERMSH
jgi:hypothetical protein